MGIGQANAKAEDIERKVFLKGDVLELVDKMDDNRVIGTIRSWNRRRLTFNQENEAHYEFMIEQRNDGVATPENLAKYDLAYRNILHEIVVREEPEGVEVLWTFRTFPSGVKIR